MYYDAGASIPEPRMCCALCTDTLRLLLLFGSVTPLLRVRLHFYAPVAVCVCSFVHHAFSTPRHAHRSYFQLF